MSVKQTIIKFEHDGSINLHEMLCLALHEGNIHAVTDLIDNIIDIDEVSTVDIEYKPD